MTGDDAILKQTQRLAVRRGFGVRDEIIDSARQMISTASCHPHYDKYKEISFIYEKLDDSTTSTARDIAEEWIQNPANVRRAEMSVGRRADPVQHDLIGYFGAFRFKAIPNKWKETKDGLSAQKRPNSTVVIIALEPMSHENGCFIELQPGQDFCVDGNDSLLVPGNGNGLGIFLDLHI